MESFFFKRFETERWTVELLVEELIIKFGAPKCWSTKYVPLIYTIINPTIWYISQNGQRSYPLRPELIESTYWLFKATRDYRCVFIYKVKIEVILF